MPLVDALREMFSGGDDKYIDVGSEEGRLRARLYLAAAGELSGEELNSLYKSGEATSVLTDEEREAVDRINSMSDEERGKFLRDGVEKLQMRSDEVISGFSASDPADMAVIQAMLYVGLGNDKEQQQEFLAAIKQMNKGKNLQGAIFGDSTVGAIKSFSPDVLKESKLGDYKLDKEGFDKLKGAVLERLEKGRGREKGSREIPLDLPSMSLECCDSVEDATALSPSASPSPDGGRRGLSSPVV